MELTLESIVYPMHPGCCGFLGYPDQALKSSQGALALAELSPPFIIAFSLDYAATFHQFRQERQTPKNRQQR